MSEISKPKFNVKRNVITIIMLFFMFVFPHLPPFGEVTPFGMGALGALIGAVIGWVFLDMYITNIAGIIALGFDGLYESFGDVFVATFASNTSVMMLGCLMVCAFMEVMNLTNVISGYMLNTWLAKRTMTGFIFCLFVVAWLISCLSSALVGVYFCCVLYRGMVHDAKIPAGDKLNSFIVLGIAIAAGFGTIAFPFKASAIIVLSTIESGAGITFSFLQYVLFCTTTQFIVMFLYTLFGKFAFRLDFTRLTAAEVEKIQPDKKQRLGLICIGLMILAFMLSSSNIWLFKYLTLGGIAIGIVFIMLLIQVDGKPLMDIGAIAGKFSWGMYLMMAYFYGFNNFISADNAGITKTCEVYLSPFLSRMPTVAFLILILLFTVILTNFLNNMPIAVIFISLIGALSSSLPGLNAEAACIAIIVAAYASCATPASSPQTAIGYAQTDLVDAKTTMIMGTVAAIFLFGLSIVTYLIMCLFM